MPTSENLLGVDLDGDGVPELISVGDGAVFILPVKFPKGGIDPLGAFPSNPQYYVVPNSYSQSVAAADFNDDGKPDLATALLEKNAVAVLLNTTTTVGDIRMQVGATTFDVGVAPNAIAVADFDGDGRPDIATANSAGGVSVLINTTPAGADAASFAPQVALPTARVFQLGTADFNGDGKPDIAVVGNGTVSILLNTTAPGASAPSFSAPQLAGTFDSNYAFPTLAVADLDGNGRPDIAVPDKDGAIAVFFNATSPGGTQTSFTRYPVAVSDAGNVYTILVADINADGVPDLLAVGGDKSGGSSLVALQNRTTPGAPLFAGFDLQEFRLGTAVDGITVADFNGDGKPDVIESDYDIAPFGSPHLDVAINTTGLPAAQLDQQGITGSWYNPATSGQGFEIEVYPNLVADGAGLLSGSWFTFGNHPDAGRRWFLLSGDVSAGQPLSKVGIYQPSGGAFDIPPQGSTPASRVGSATIAFSDCNHGLLHYEMLGAPDDDLPFPYGRSGLIPLTRLLPRPNCTSSSNAATSAAPASLLSGNWYNSATPGQGFIFDISPEAQSLFAAWYTFEPGNAQTAPIAPQNWYTLQAPFVDASAPLHDIPIVQTSGGVFDDPTATMSVQVGSADLDFQSCSAMTLSFRMTGGAAAGRSGTIPLQRVGPTPAGCALH